MANLKPKYNCALIIDDSEMDNMLNKMILEVANYASDILTFSCPNEALKYLGKKNIKTPEIIFLDINMPEMNGFEFLEEFEKLPAGTSALTKVIIISSSDDPIDVQRASHHKSIVKYLKKPLNRAELY